MSTFIRWSKENVDEFLTKFNAYFINVKIPLLNDNWKTLIIYQSLKDHALEWVQSQLNKFSTNLISAIEV